MTSLQLGFLYMAPWLALLLALICGHYPGERRLARIRARRSRRRRAVPLVVAGVAWDPRGPGGGLLLAHRLSGRAPPLTV